MNKPILLLFVLIFSGISFNLSGQSLQVRVIRGKNPFFYIQSLKQVQDGVTWEKFTRFEIIFNDAGDPGTNTWDMKFYSPTATFDGEGGGTLDLNKFELSSYLDNVFEYKKTLTNINTTIMVDGGPEGTSYVDITYEVGVTNTFWNVTPDYYYGSINFDVFATW